MKLSTKCRMTCCTNTLSPVFSEKFNCYVIHENCWDHIDPYVKDIDRLTRHEHHKDMPAIFRETQLDMIPNERIKEALKYRGSNDYSYLFHGITGAGKTRAAWWITDLFWRNNYPMRFEFLSPRKLDSIIIGSFGDGIDKHEAAIDRLCRIPLLVIDDLGKERLTPRMESDLFSIVDERLSNKKPLIVTTNFNSQGLIERFPTKETAHALIRRMREGMKMVGTGMEDAK